MLYEGEERARQLSLGASAKRFEGEIMAQGGRDAARAGVIKGFGTAARGVGSMYEKYGGGGPKPRPGVASPLDEGWLDAGTEGYANFG